jgi:hypothetical protein
MEKLDLSESEVKLALKQMKRKSQIPIISGSLKQFLNACEPRTDCRHHLRSSPTHNILHDRDERPWESPRRRQRQQVPLVLSGMDSRRYVQWGPVLEFRNPTDSQSIFNK